MDDDDLDKLVDADDDGSEAPEGTCVRTGESHQFNDLGFCRHCGMGG